MAVLEHGTYDQWGMIDPEYDNEGNLTEAFVNSYVRVWDILAPYLNKAKSVLLLRINVQAYF